MTASTNRPELLTQLTDGISDLTTSDKWRHYLDFQGRFHHYSYSNVLLIAAQNSEATRVAGFNTWRKLERFVHKGEKAIWILAPMVYKDADGGTGENNRVVRGFKFVPVFDVSQTDGAELPSICDRIEGDDPGGLYDQLLTVAQSIGFTVADYHFAGSTNGDCSHASRRIRIETSNSAAQRVKTLAHEIAHAVLHEEFQDRAVAELEAESVAYIVCQVHGFDTSGYSFGYVATWAGGSEHALTGIKTSCERIQRCAATILQAFEPAHQEIVAA
jgi:N-terminal domain of anti-restriction factor ArdC/IrrE N-terminal-like domain